MEWCCAKCGLAATAEDRGLLLAMGWRVLAGEMRCVICVKKEPERVAGDVAEFRAAATLRPTPT